MMGFFRSLGHAFRGVRYTYEHERNFRIHSAISLVVIVLGVSLGMTKVQWLFVITAIATVLALEIVNTVFERVVDMFQPRVHEYAAIIKDLMAATVLVASISAAIIGSLIFVPLIISRIT